MPGLDESHRIAKREIPGSSPGDIATRPVEAGDEAIPDWVAPAREDDGDRRSRCLSCERRVEITDDHGYRPANQITN